MSAIITIEDFVRRYHSRLSTYLNPGGRAPDANRSELKDFSEQVAAIASHPGSNLSVRMVKNELKRLSVSIHLRPEKYRIVLQSTAVN